MFDFLDVRVFVFLSLGRIFVRIGFSTAFKVTQFGAFDRAHRSRRLTLNTCALHRSILNTHTLLSLRKGKNDGEKKIAVNVGGITTYNVAQQYVCIVKMLRGLYRVHTFYVFGVCVHSCCNFVSARTRREYV